jgi:hypothetical protein
MPQANSTLETFTTSLKEIHESSLLQHPNIPNDEVFMVKLLIIPAIQNKDKRAHIILTLASETFHFNATKFLHNNESWYSSPEKMISNVQQVLNLSNNSWYNKISNLEDGSFKNLLLSLFSVEDYHKLKAPEEKNLSFEFDYRDDASINHIATLLKKTDSFPSSYPGTPNSATPSQMHSGHETTGTPETMSDDHIARKLFQSVKEEGIETNIFNGLSPATDKPDNTPKPLYVPSDGAPFSGISPAQQDGVLANMRQHAQSSKQYQIILPCAYALSMLFNYIGFLPSNWLMISCMSTAILGVVLLQWTMYAATNYGQQELTRINANSLQLETPWFFNNLIYLGSAMAVAMSFIAQPILAMMYATFILSLSPSLATNQVHIKHLNTIESFFKSTIDSRHELDSSMSLIN